MFFGLANMAEIVIAVWLLRISIGPASVLSSLNVFIRFTLIGFFASTTSGFLGAVSAWSLLGEPFLVSWMAWTLSDALGLLVFAPFFLALFRGDYVRWIQEKSPFQRFETAALLALTLAVAWILFYVVRSAPIFILLVPTMLVTLRIGQLGTKAAVLLIAAVGLSSTFLKTGLIYRAGDYDEQILILQIFLFVLLFSSLPVAADLTARGRAVVALGRREQELRELATTDALTGLLNPSAFTEFAEEVLSRPENQQVCLITIDVDHFKRSTIRLAIMPGMRHCDIWRRSRVHICAAWMHWAASAATNSCCSCRMQASSMLKAFVRVSEIACGVHRFAAKMAPS